MNFIELITFQLSNLLILHVGKYYNFNFYQKYIGWGLITLLIIYYLIFNIKNKKYINKWIIIAYLISSITNYFSLKFILVDSWDPYFYINIILILIIAIVNFSVNILKKENNNLNNKKIPIVFLIVSLLISFIPFTYGLICSNLSNQKAQKLSVKVLKEKYNYHDYKLNKNNNKCGKYECIFEYNIPSIDEFVIVQVNKRNYKVSSEHLYCLTNEECLNKAKKVADKYLKKTYNNLEYTLNNNIINSYHEYSLSYNTKYFNKPFEIVISKENYTVIFDNFTELYILSLFNGEYSSIYEFQSSYEEKMKLKHIEELTKKYDIKITSLNANFDYEKLKNEIKKGNLPSKEQLEEYISYTTYGKEGIIINKKFKKEELETFKTYIVNLYKDSRFDNSMHFVFSYGNPFAKQESVAYQDSGYIADWGTQYGLYLNPQPYHIDK